MINKIKNLVRDVTSPIKKNSKGNSLNQITEEIKKTMQIEIDNLKKDYLIKEEDSNKNMTKSSQKNFKEEIIREKNILNS